MEIFWKIHSICKGKISLWSPKLRQNIHYQQTPINYKKLLIMQIMLNLKCIYKKILNDHLVKNVRRYTLPCPIEVMQDRGSIDLSNRVMLERQVVRRSYRSCTAFRAVHRIS